MVRFVAGLILLLLAWPAAAGDEKDKTQEKPATPAEQYRALIKEFQGGMQAFQKEYSAAKTNEDKQKVFAEKYPQPHKFAPKFLDLAEKNPKDAIAVDALVWIMTNGGGGMPGKDDAQAKAIAVLMRDHVKSEKLGNVCQSLVYRVDKASEQFLRGVLENSPHKEVQGKAILALGQYLKNRRDAIQRIADNPAMAKFYDSSLDKDYLKALRDQDPAKVSSEIEAIFERITKEFAEIKHPFYGTLGTKAKSELYDIRFLAVGKVAPDVEGEDQDGKKFKLSDYRGKVVLLDFWSQY